MASRAKLCPVVYRPDYSKLFALTVGIDIYIHNEGSTDTIGAPNLHGAVADANEFEGFLFSLGAQPQRLKSLRNEAATRKNIIEALLSIVDHDDIQLHDPIVIYFAGHGGEARAPESWNYGNEPVQLLLPHDFRFEEPYVPSQRPVVHGIPDCTLQEILGRIAFAKGDNITVILDCCHSGSATRELRPLLPGSISLRSLFRILIPPGDLSIARGIRTTTTLPPNLDEDLLNGGLVTSRNGQPKGLQSHMLLCACRENERAYENGGRGAFTTSLLNAMRVAMKTTQITYAGLFELLAPLPHQNPQCEGLHRYRYIFDHQRTAPPTSSVKMDEGRLVLQAGSVHGIRPRTQFVLTDQTSDHIGHFNATAFDVGPFTTSLECSPSVCATLGSRFSGIASQRGLDDQNKYRVFSDYWPTKSGTLGSFTHWLQRTYEPASADIHLTWTTPHCTDAYVTFSLQNLHVNNRTYRVQTKARSRSPEYFHHVIRSMIHYRHHLLNNDGTEPDLWKRVGLAYSKYSPSHTSSAQFRWKDLPQTSTMSVNAKVQYIIKLDNQCCIPMFVSVFLFDYNFNIKAYYLPGMATMNGIVEPSLPAGGTLTLGYGASGTSPLGFEPPSGNKVESLMFLKIILSTQALDLSSLESIPFEESHFEGHSHDAKDYEPVVDPEGGSEPQADTWFPRGGMQCHEETIDTKDLKIWGARVIPVEICGAPRTKCHLKLWWPHVGRK